MSMIKTNTTTNTYTKPRIDVIGDQFELFFRCSGKSDQEVESLLNAIRCHELEAVGVYIEENGYRIAEVELEVDWQQYSENVHICGNLFDTDSPGWKEGKAPEAYVAAGRLLKAAKKMRLPLRSWIRVSDSVRASTSEHKKVCDKLGYAYNSSVAPWKNTPSSRSRNIVGLEELQVTSREVI